MYGTTYDRSNNTEVKILSQTGLNLDSVQYQDSFIEGDSSELTIKNFILRDGASSFNKDLSKSSNKTEVY